MKQQFIGSFDELPLVLTVHDLAEVMGVSRAGAYALARSEGFPAIRIGRRIAIPKSELIKWMEQQSTRGGRL